MRFFKNRKLSKLFREYEQINLTKIERKELKLYQRIRKRLKIPKRNYLQGENVLKNLGLSLED